MATSRTLRRSRYHDPVVLGSSNPVHRRSTGRTIRSALLGSFSRQYHRHRRESNPVILILIQGDQSKTRCRIIDWDSVVAEPLRLSALSIGDTLFRWALVPLFLADSQEQRFREEISRLEKERLQGAPWFSRHLRNSRENFFLFDVLQPRVGSTFADLETKYPDLLPLALKRSSETWKAAAAEWEYFVNLIGEAGAPYLGTPFYVEIQEGLGLYGKNALERFVRMIKRRGYWKWKQLLHRFRKAPHPG